jgi:uncharacterized membrane protein YhiD involved in acid resistance
MIDSLLLFKFGTAMFIGILTGLQREFALEEKHREVVGGIRTFVLISLTGCAAAFISDTLTSPCRWPQRFW